MPSAPILYFPNLPSEERAMADMIPDCARPPDDQFSGKTMIFSDYDMKCRVRAETVAN
jgi:hypothetical protein